VSEQKYFVRIMRPVFVRAVFEVTAESIEEAERKAVSMGEELPPPEWSEDPALAVETQPPIPEAVAEAADYEDEDDFDPMDLLDDRDCDYALLQANHAAGEGRSRSGVVGQVAAHYLCGLRRGLGRPHG